jgi:trehalose 6-phosphate phosphatase
VDDRLRAALDDLARHETLLVGVDFDGTLAPLGDEPMDVAPVPGAMPVLGELADLPGVTVALVSGRALAPLRQLTGATDPLVLIGSHGAESSLSTVSHALTDEERARYDALDEALEGLLHRHPEVRLERKPSALVLHTRGLAEPAARAALDAGAELASGHAGVTVTPGKDVLELAVSEAGKGPALLDLAAAVGAEAILYAGDDVTDERAFAHLRAGDVSVKVGDGETAAGHRLADEPAVVEMLEHLRDRRSAHAGGGHPA